MRLMSRGKKAREGILERISGKEILLPSHLRTVPPPMDMARKTFSSPQKEPVTKNFFSSLCHAGRCFRSPKGPHPTRRWMASRQFVFPAPFFPVRRFRPGPHMILPGERLRKFLVRNSAHHIAVYREASSPSPSSSRERSLSVSLMGITMYRKSFSSGRSMVICPSGPLKLMKTLSP